MSSVAGVGRFLIVPTYNEAANLARLAEAIAGLKLDLGVIVVDDDSPDGTGRIADELANRHAAFGVIHRTDQRGLGTAYLAGFREALRRGADAVLTMDCDFSHDPGTLPLMIAAAEHADVVIGSRYADGGQIQGMPWHRRLVSRAANRFVHALFHIPAHDCTSGFRLYRRRIVEGIPWERVRSSGYSFLVECLYWASRQGGAKIVEVPICFRDRKHGKSKLGWHEAFIGARKLLRLWADVGRD